MKIPNIASMFQIHYPGGRRGMCITLAIVGSIHLLFLVYLYDTVLSAPIKVVTYLHGSAVGSQKQSQTTETYESQVLSKRLKQAAKIVHKRAAPCNRKHVIDEKLQIPKNKVFTAAINSEFPLNWFFRSRLRRQDRKIIRNTLNTFDKVMTKSGINYTIYGGTLIGSYRHHGLVPWDDDIDVIVPISASKLLYHTFNKLEPEYFVNTDSVYFWKMFSASAFQIKCYPWRWPFIDIFFYAENETHIWNSSPMYKTRYVFPKNNVFPLRRRPYMDLYLLAPHNPSAVIAQTYHIGACKSGTWIHRLETYTSELTVPCTMLYSKFPFVMRSAMNGGCNESLIHNGNIINYFFDSNVIC